MQAPCETMAGITGHRDLRDEATATWVSAAVGREIERLSITAGICCLAIGADQLFAQEILARGLPLTAVVPSRRYEDTFEEPDQRTRFRALLERSFPRIALDNETNSDEAFLAASRVVVEAAGVVLAVWDGSPARGPGGTADVVEYARDLRKQLVHIDPFRRTITTGI